MQRRASLSASCSLPIATELHHRQPAATGEVDQGERLGLDGPVREALVVVPSAAHSDADAVAAAAEHGGLGVGGVGGRDDAERAHRAGGGEPGVPDVRRQDGGEGRRALREDVLARNAGREAVEEVAGGSRGGGGGVETHEANGEHQCSESEHGHFCCSELARTMCFVMLVSSSANI